MKTTMTHNRSAPLNGVKVPAPLYRRLSLLLTKAPTSANVQDTGLSCYQTTMIPGYRDNRLT